jgi:hypothetical protein
MDDKKPRGDALESRLPETVARELRDGLLGGWTYAEAQEWLAEQGHSASSGALSGYWQRVCGPVMRERRRLAAMRAEEVARDASQEAVDWDSAALDRLRQVTFELLLAPGVDADQVKSLMGLVLRARAQDLDSRRVKLLEERAAQADAARGVMGDEALSEEQRRERLREIFRMG